METRFPNLFRPLKIKNTLFRNRIFSAPNQTRFRDHSEIAFFETKARGGAAQVTIGETPVTSTYYRQSLAYTFVLDDPHDIRFLAEAALGIKLHGAAASIQLFHPGQYATVRSKDDPRPIGPVGFTRDDGVKVIAMDEEMMEETIEAFAKAAENVRRAGFDGCQIHAGAHGWLLAQFLSPLTNKRRDRYGGSLENRASFPVGVVKRIRERCGPDFLIEYRISGDELVEGGLRIEEVIEFVKMIEDIVDLVHVSAGIHENKKTVSRMFPVASFTEHGCNVYLAEAVKRAVKIPVITVGGISEPSHAERILSEGKADIIAMGRALIADPELPNKARIGKVDEIVPCIRCNNCLVGLGYNDSFACSVNPRVGRELKLHLIQKPENTKKVVVVGGGPAGMEAAITAAERGHEVILFEKDHNLGGILKITDYDPMKRDLKEFKDYLVRKTSRNVEVRTDTEVSPTMIKALRPEYLIVAIGSRPLIPKIPGVEQPFVKTALEAYSHPESTGDGVVVIGGALVGCEIGMYLANLGKDVEIIEMKDDLGDPVNWRYSLPLIERLNELENVTCRTGMRCVEIKSGGVEAIDKGNKNHFLEAEGVVLATGMVPDFERVESYMKCAPNVFPVGDCMKPQNVLEAVRSGYFAAMDIV